MQAFKAVVGRGSNCSRVNPSQMLEGSGGWQTAALSKNTKRQACKGLANCTGAHRKRDEQRCRGIVWAVFLTLGG